MDEVVSQNTDVTFVFIGLKFTYPAESYACTPAVPPNAGTQFNTPMETHMYVGNK